MDLELARKRLRERLANGLSLPDLELSQFHVPGHGGMSHETLLCDARWSVKGETVERGLAIRVEPEGHHLFPDTNLHLQCRTMRALRERGGVPVPEVLFEDPDPDALGRPYYVMERIEGRIPSDTPPYQIAGWLFEAEAEEQARAQSQALEIMADIHRGEVDGFGFLARADHDSPGLDAELAHWRSYLDWLADGERLPVLEAAFAWCVEHRPSAPPALALNWGDARMGNLVFGPDFTITAVLDWEMAHLAPPEVDLGWFLFLHETALIWLKDLPGFRGRDASLELYARALGRELQDLAFYEAWGGFRAAAIQARMVERDRARGAEPPLSKREDNPVVTSLRRLIELP